MKTKWVIPLLINLELTRTLAKQIMINKGDTEILQ